jgi:hypothetical protein
LPVIAPQGHFGEKPCFADGAFQFLRADVRKLHKQPFSLDFAAALTGENCRDAVGCSKTEMHPSPAQGLKCAG